MAIDPSGFSIFRSLGGLLGGGPAGPMPSPPPLLTPQQIQTQLQQLQLLGGIQNGQHRTARQALHSSARQASRTGQLAQLAQALQAPPGFAVARNPNYPVHAGTQAVENSGIELGEIQAWRAWRVDEVTGLLRSMISDATWIPREPMTIRDHELKKLWPDRAGVYAFKSPSQIVAEFMSFTHQPLAIGIVSLYGDVIEHDHGWRATHCMIERVEQFLSWDPAWGPIRRHLLDHLRGAYDTPQDSREGANSE